MKHKVNGAFTRKTFVLRVKQKCYYILMYCFTRKTRKRQSGHTSGVKPIVLRVKPFVRVKQKYYYILIIVLRVKPTVLRVKRYRRQSGQNTQA